MIAKLIEFSSRNRFFIFLLTGMLVAWGYWALKHTPLDAIPDLSDTQVIIYTEWPGRSPDLVENQITYPISSTLLAAPEVNVVRGFSFLGSSFVYVIFKEGTDIYWARSRVLEYLQSVRTKLPQDVSPVLGPDATSLGWGFSYAVVDEKGKMNLAELRSLQDWHIKLALESVPGVSQVASVGGFVKQYQVIVDPIRLRSYGLTLMDIMNAIKASNIDVEGRVLELSGAEYMIRGRGYIKNLQDIKNTVLRSEKGVPVLLRDVARIELGPEIRRGIAELNGQGEVVGGIVIVRFGENVLNVIERVKEKIKTEIEPSLPEGVKIIVTYDRSDLIYRAVDTLREEIIKLAVAVSAVCLVFLLHLPSALVIILTLPVAIIASFILIHQFNVTSNIMSLSGIAIAIGAMVDASIIMVENAHKKLEEINKVGFHHNNATSYRINVIIEAAKEVGPSLFFSLLVITVGFLPVFTLEAQAGRLFKPLAFTKTFAMLFASFLAVTLTPALMTLFIRGKVLSEEKNPVSIILHKIFEPLVRLALRFKYLVIAGAIIIMALTYIPIAKLGTEFMPPLYEGTLFYMPVTAPGLSAAESARLLQIQDRIIKSIPEVELVFGKAGRAETATDPAPLEMFETVINLKPESQWREGMNVEKLKDELNEKLSIPGVANSFTMPIKARIDMLATGIRTPAGIKILGPDIETIEKIGIEIEDAIKDIPGTRSVYAERVNTGYFIDIKPRREVIARYGLSIEEVNTFVQTAIGGMNITTTVEGRERYPVNIRYPRELRDSIEKLKSLPVPLSPAGSEKNTMDPSTFQQTFITLGQLADIEVKPGPTMIKSEEGLLAAYVYIDFSSKDIGGYIEEVKKRIREKIKIPPGYRLQYSGEYEYMLRTHERLKLVIPLTIFIIFVLIYLNTRSVTKTFIVLLAVPFSLVGSFWFLHLLGYNLSTAVWVGLIALAGLDAETGVVMLLYLELAYQKWVKEGRLKTIADLRDAIMYGAVKRIRPKIMTVSVILAGLIPIMFSQGTGSDVMKRIAAPMIGGVITSTILELIIYPVIYMLIKKRALNNSTPSASL
ncbi:MAG: CusA/CzcA family heavy metal efflux RND transporter [Thermodesulfovibrionales bacterium]|nr:CusA/CzcA family heavy metal efflux RND transporter [Thermodesulfovibrionales bacterium]